MHKLVICDDDSKQLQRLREILLDNYPEGSFELSLFSDADSLLEALDREDFQPEIAILDIVIKDKSGISLAKKLNSCRPDCAVIFISSFIDYAMDVYDTRHSYFVLKSQLEQRIIPALQKVLQELREKLYINFRVSGITQTVAASQVLYLERKLKKTSIYLANGCEYQCSEKPGQLLEDSGCGSFICCHQSYYVNPDFVASMEKDCFILSDGSTVPISRSHQAQARARFFAAISQ